MNNKKLLILILIIWPYLYLFPHTFKFIEMGNDFELLYYSYKKYIFEFLMFCLFIEVNFHDIVVPPLILAILTQMCACTRNYSKLMSFFNELVKNIENKNKKNRNITMFFIEGRKSGFHVLACRKIPLYFTRGGVVTSGHILRVYSFGHVLEAL